jgi:hypothetical protein
MASQIARGERVSLAVPVLANIYRSLRGLTSSRDPSRCRELVPWHFISGWLHMYWSGLYHPSLSSEIKKFDKTKKYKELIAVPNFTEIDQN